VCPAWDCRMLTGRLYSVFERPDNFMRNAGLLGETINTSSNAWKKVHPTGVFTVRGMQRWLKCILSTYLFPRFHKYQDAPELTYPSSRGFTSHPVYTALVPFFENKVDANLAALFDPAENNLVVKNNADFYAGVEVSPASGNTFYPQANLN